MSIIRIGTRGSPLALAQAHETRQKLLRAHDLEPDAIEIIKIETTGDRIRDRPLAEIGGKGLFTKEVEEALLEQRIDLAVHSMKDMPAEFPPGLDIVCLLEREDPRDAFLSPVAKDIASLPANAVVGSSSVRRAAQVKRLRPDLEVVPFRGNVGTRLKKLQDGIAQATFLACAGLNRLGMGDKITSPVPVGHMMPAVAQGTIGIEVRESDTRIRTLLEPLNHAETATRIDAERGFLCSLDGSCRTPLAGHAVLEGQEIVFEGMALTMDGSGVFEARRRGPVTDAMRLGQDAAEEVRGKAGDRLFA